jgi:hypothetical protein
MMTPTQLIDLTLIASDVEHAAALVMLDDLRAALGECHELRAALEHSTNQLSLYIEGDKNTATANLVREHRKLLCV